MMKSKKLIISLVCILALILAGYLLWPYAFTVVPIEEVEQQKLSEAFDPVAYVDGIWESQIIPKITKESVSMSDVLNAMQPNPAGLAAKEDLIKVAEKYGLITVGEAHIYLVKLTGKVTAVDTKTSLGIMEVQPDGYGGPIKVRVYVGPRIPSDETSIRDGVGFIDFGDFKEQTEYGKVGAEINKRVVGEVLDSLDREALVGKTVTVYGALTIRTFNLINIDLKKLTIVPIKIEVEG
jgi:predicted lipoprotein